MKQKPQTKEQKKEQKAYKKEQQKKQQDKKKEEKKKENEDKKKDPKVDVTIYEKELASGKIPWIESTEGIKLEGDKQFGGVNANGESRGQAAGQVEFNKVDSGYNAKVALNHNGLEAGAGLMQDIMPQEEKDKFRMSWQMELRHMQKHKDMPEWWQREVRLIDSFQSSCAWLAGAVS